MPSLCDEEGWEDYGDSTSGTLRSVLMWAALRGLGQVGPRLQPERSGVSPVHSHDYSHSTHRSSLPSAALTGVALLRGKARSFIWASFDSGFEEIQQPAQNCNGGVWAPVLNQHGCLRYYHLFAGLWQPEEFGSS